LTGIDDFTPTYLYGCCCFLDTVHIGLLRSLFCFTVSWRWQMCE